MTRRRIEVSGLVQGVGFRPYVYRLATERRLSGHILNTAAGVLIEVQGSPEAIESFLASLPREAPPLARVTEVRVSELSANGDREFRILASEKSEACQTLISPDVAVCADCLRELFDPRDRRYLYPFINCTNCGPRFTIVRDIPYDRPRTSMAAFRMCDACQAEYDDPANRRFHAQPNACWHCGPRVELWDASGRALAADDPIAEAAARLGEGAIVAVKGLGGFHLAAVATDAAVVRRLRQRKHRVEKPFAVMVASLDVARELCAVTPLEEALLQGPERSVVLLERRPGCPIPEEVAPSNRTLGLFLPYTPLHHVLFARLGPRPLVMTSGNLSEEPIAIDNQEAVDRLGRLADFFLVHNRDILRRADDSVIRHFAGRARPLRRSRGFVPAPVFLDRDLPPVLAVGGELKNTVAVLKGRHAFLSQHIGDLENAEGYSFFLEAIEHLERILEVRPTILACDLHPDYFSTRWAQSQPGMRCVGVQHHHAHIASCMAENHLDGEVIGIALDGTGLGTDGRIWGGEVLLAGYTDFRRAAHFREVPMPGGAAAIREPWRMAVSWLWQRFGNRLFDLPLPLLGAVPRRKIETVVRMIERRVNAPLTSSCGRLFDAIAALVGLRLEVSYEGQAAIELEMCRDESVADGAYSFQVHEQEGAWCMDPGPVVEAAAEDVIAGLSQGSISQKFHQAVVRALADVAARLGERTGLARVCLSGGAFQNACLAASLEQRLRTQGFEVFTHSQVPANDGGLSLGQAVVAAHRVAAA
ncbi:MAG: carbamoyltransferase HypF, partial [Acidobacteria bacterium]